MTGITGDLNRAINEANEPPDERGLEVMETVRGQGRGRPCKEISRTFLEQALSIGGPTKIAREMGCSSRTVRRRILDYGLDEPKPPVFSVVEAPDGSLLHLHQTSTAAVSNITDVALDECVLACHNQQYQLKILFLHVYRHTTNFNFDVYIHGKFA